MIYEMRCPGTNFEKPGILTPVTDGTAIFPSVPAAIFTITDQTKERYKKLHAFQSPEGRLELPKGDWSSRREFGAPEGRLELPKGDWSPEGRLVSRREIGFPKGHLSMEYIYKYSVLGNRNRSDSLPCYCERPRPFRRLRLEAALRFSPACYCEITPRTPFVGV